jgi:hypothetical protein
MKGYGKEKVKLHEAANTLCFRQFFTFKNVHKLALFCGAKKKLMRSIGSIGAGILRYERIVSDECGGELCRVNTDIVRAPSTALYEELKRRARACVAASG